MKILFSNLGYAKGMDGSLAQHVRRAGRHVYYPAAAQRQVLAQFRAILEQEQPDVACLVEIESGSVQTAYYNQIHALAHELYPVHDIADKYGETAWISRLPFHQGKSNAFLARQPMNFRRRYWAHGTKRLVYEIHCGEMTLFFAHFSLRREVRQRQLAETEAWLRDVAGEVMLLADFNVLQGLHELDDFRERTGLLLLNRADEPTFRFHRRQLVLDLCLCTPKLAASTRLRIIPQPFSDHAALLVECPG